MPGIDFYVGEHSLQRQMVKMLFKKPRAIALFNARTRRSPKNMSRGWRCRDGIKRGEENMMVPLEPEGIGN